MSFPGGGVFLPTRSAADRHLLIKYVDAHLRASPQVQVLLGNQRWVAQPSRSATGVRCGRCDGTVERALASPTERATYCVSCALGVD